MRDRSRLLRGIVGMALSMSMLACTADDRVDRDAVLDDTTGESGAEPAATYDPNNVGSISGRITLEGEVPELPPLEVSVDPNVCGPGARYDRLEIGSGNGIRNVVVYLEQVSGGRAIAEGQSVLMDQIGCRYLPHVVLAPVGTRVIFTNSDPVAHNVRVESEAGGPLLMNVAQPMQGRVDTLVVKQKGAMSVGCDYHPWMNAYVFGVDNPYATLTAEDGSFTIDGIPPGTYTLKTWLNGVGVAPKKDNQGKLIGYRFSDPHLSERQVTVVADSATAVEMSISLAGT